MVFVLVAAVALGLAGCSGEDKAAAPAKEAPAAAKEGEEAWTMFSHSLFSHSRSSFGAF